MGSVRCSPLGPGRSCGSSWGGKSPVSSLMMRPYCFFSKVELSICLYSVRWAALSCVRRDWFLLRMVEISFAMNALDGAVLRFL